LLNNNTPSLLTTQDQLEDVWITGIQYNPSSTTTPKISHTTIFGTQDAESPPKNYFKTASLQREEPEVLHLSMLPTRSEKINSTTSSLLQTERSETMMFQGAIRYLKGQNKMKSSESRKLSAMSLEVIMSLIFQSRVLSLDFQKVKSLVDQVLHK
jgi:hypothetical protein